jgi:hypothetical protein
MVWSQDPRLSIIISDAVAWLNAYTGPSFDVIILDISDPDFGMSTEPEEHEKGYGTGGLKPGEEDEYEAPRLGPADQEIVGPTHPIYQTVRRKDQGGGGVGRYRTQSSLFGRDAFVLFGFVCFFQSFFQLIKRKLSPNGVLVLIPCALPSPCNPTQHTLTTPPPLSVCCTMIR